MIASICPSTSGLKDKYWVLELTSTQMQISSAGNPLVLTKVNGRYPGKISGVGIEEQVLDGGGTTAGTGNAGKGGIGAGQVAAADI